MNIKKIFAIALVATAIFIAFSKNAALSLFNHPIIFQDNPKNMKNYNPEWKKVDSLENKGLTESALKIVEAVYKSAKQENNAPQIIKALIHRAKFYSYKEEDALVKSILQIEKDAEELSFPGKQVAHSVVAELYWRYYQNNRWRFLNRTETVDFIPDDIRTWDLRKIVSKTIYHYNSSLTETNRLQQIPVEYFDAIVISTQKEGRNLRPSLYEFLAHRAVDFYANDEASLTQSAEAFHLNNENYFLHGALFSKIKIPANDTFSFSYQAIQVFKELTTYQLEQKNSDAIVDTELKRLAFVKRKSSLTDKATLYENTINALIDIYNGKEAVAHLMYEKALLYNGITYNTSNPETKAAKQKAAALCNEAIDKYPKSFGAGLCKYLLAQIQEKSMSLSTERVNPKEKEFRALLSYKNLDKIYFKIVENPFPKNKERYYYDEANIKKLLTQKALKSWELKLPEDKDYNPHSLEMVLPEMPYGTYFILCSDNASFEYKSNYAIAYAEINISNMAYLTRNNNDGTIDGYVFERTSGEKLKNVTVQLWVEKYNYSSRKYEFEKREKLTSDNDGYFKVPIGADYRNLHFEFINGDDKLYSYNAVYQYKPYREDKKWRTHTYFFADRSIFRPGQTIYFKGIVVETNGDSTRIKTNFSSNVILYDVNYQKITEQLFTTNEFGTFNGSFTLPSGVLNGQMHLNNSYGSYYFSVEEYKRPKFEVSVDPVKGSFRLNDKVNISGIAKSYAGAVVDGAEVKYRVSRNARYNWWWWYYRGGAPTSAAMEITNGTSVTKEDGTFTFDFTAIPDKSLSKQECPSFSYTVYVDVTDINGETRSTSYTLNVGYQSLMIDIDLPAQVNFLDKDEFILQTKNLNGQAEAADVKLIVHRVQSTNRIIRNRLWSKADKFIYSENEYIKKFPHDEYTNETSQSQFVKKEKTKDALLNTKEKVKLNLQQLGISQPGIYLIELSLKDAYGEEVKEERYIEVYNPNSKELLKPCPEFFTIIKDKGEPGEKAAFLIGSSYDNVEVLVEVEHEKNIEQKEWVKLNKEQKLLEFSILEKHRGNFVVHFTFVKNGRSYIHSQTIYVPHTNKQLDIVFETFRDKLLPGQDEEWRLKIKDKKGDKVAAEMVAAMYDASLDAFKPHNWYLNLYRNYYSNFRWQSNVSGISATQLYAYSWNTYPAVPYRQYDYLNWFGYEGYYYGYYRGGRFAGGVVSKSAPAAYAMEEDAELKEMEQTATLATATGSTKKNSEKAKREDANQQAIGDKADGKSRDEASGEIAPNKDARGGEEEIAVRKNLQETAFFMPDLKTNEQGEIIISFKAPEALTKWKFLGLAHTKDLKLGTITKETVTQKELMVTPNLPRFFREGDKLNLSIKINNLTENDIQGQSELQILDAYTRESLDHLFSNKEKQKSFSAKKEQSASSTWNISIPEGVYAVIIRTTAKSGKHTDGEETVIPVLTNRMLVTETLPLPVRGNQTKNFTFEKLINQNNGSTTLKNHQLTLEFTANPVWYAIQALPYMMEYPYECAEQTFSRYYANSIATHVANSHPKIKAVFESWKIDSPEALLSNLEKNQELKSVILAETPWVLDAKSETERKKRVALLFDMNRMSKELASARKKLMQLQSSNGGFMWFKGMRDDRYITQHIVAGIGHLQHLNITNAKEDREMKSMLHRAVNYLDNRIREDYEYLIKHKVDLSKNHLGYYQIHYFYARSFFTDIKVSSQNQKAFDYYFGQMKKYWLDNSRYSQGMIALALHRYGDKLIPADIVKSLKENALFHDELGMYWKENIPGYYWYQAPIETHSLLLEVFNEVAKDKKSVDELRIWLLKQKQVQDWKTTKATAEACYALLLTGTDWTQTTADNIEIKLGDISFVPSKVQGLKVEAGTGYFKTSWKENQVKPQMGNITVTKKDEGIGWGAVYWQYFENLDKITAHETPLKLNKKLFIEKTSATGNVMVPLDKNHELKVGDKIIVRIELRVDRSMEYVHMKDMRASCFEPLNVISGYRYQGGLGYYESTGDAATNFFFDYLPKGTYVFEYPLRVFHTGDFSNGITTIQSMYAPEFTSHSEGIRVNVKEK
jgi:uncharacterized protein YfaS (alpha-2-macroglobulin family)